jgi:hypothetical protein
MPKKKTAEIVSTLDRKTSGIRRRVPVAPVAVTTPAMGPVVPLIPGFENKVGRYELVRVDGNQAYYSFTNRQGRTVDSIMSVTMWGRMQARADATFQETT